MGIMIQRHGWEDFEPYLWCSLCGKPFASIGEAWLSFAPLTEGVEEREAMFTHRRCVDGEAQRLFGTSAVTHWRARDALARLLQPRGLQAVARIAAQRRKWSHHQ
jgi:hypothetical protein